MKNKKRLQVVAAVTALLMGCSILTACQNSEQQTSSDGTEGKTEVVENSEVADEGNEIIEVTSVRTLDSTLQFAEGEDINNNKWTQSLLDEYGIKVNYKWTVPSDQFSEKRSLMLSTGDIPDFFYLDSTGFEQAVASDMLYDLSEVYEEYASDALK